MSWQESCRSCRSCGMDMDLEPYCVKTEVLALRTAETSREYPWGLDVGRAWRLCCAKWFEQRESRGTTQLSECALGSRPPPGLRG